MVIGRCAMLPMYHIGTNAKPGNLQESRPLVVAGAMPKAMKAAVGVVAVAAALWPSASAAHVERPSYWPDPAADCSISPCTGGKVPTARSLASALDRSRPGDTRVVCQDDSLIRLRRSIVSARRSGYDVRPTDHRSLSARQARYILRLNRALRRRCRYHEIQPAITASHNNDRVVIMPGVYTEPTSRSKPTGDPACAQYKTHADSGDPGALSHAYQVHCPNDANLVAVIGRDVGPGTDPDPPREDRHGIPNLGPCIRCNLQVEGSGVSADDVAIDAGDASKGNGGPSAVGEKKHVGVFVDRADGFVLRKVTVRHAREHDIYVMESDGYLLDQFKTFYAGSYGVLTFVEDHGLMENCEAMGNGDSGLYPGAGAKTSAGRDTHYYPEFRYSQELRNCDSHHNDGGYSGTNGNATYIHDNNFFDNALGFTTDVFTAPGHPGFPQQGDKIENNNFYDNNFNPFIAGSDVRPFIPAPVGTGLWIAGGNDNVVRGNRFWNNYRRGAMLFAVPDSTVCGPPPVGSSTPVPGCDPSKTSTSYDNTFTQNVMGVGPGDAYKPNGVDFWWDSFAGNTGNCWYGNVPASGHAITSSPGALPSCGGGSNPGSSMGTGNVANEAELLTCFVGFTVGNYPEGNSTLCNWEVNPPRPGTARASSAIARARQEEFTRLCAAMPGNRTCASVAPAGTAFSPLPMTSAPAPIPLSGAWARRPLGLYTCGDWVSGGHGLQSKLLARLRRFTGGAVEGSGFLGYGSVLPDVRARALFDARCKPRYARSFALYKLYGQAAGFAGVAP
jgi:hypothetical protein